MTEEETEKLTLAVAYIRVASATLGLCIKDAVRTLCESGDTERIERYPDLVPYAKKVRDAMDSIIEIYEGKEEKE